MQSACRICFDQYNEKSESLDKKELFEKLLYCTGSKLLTDVIVPNNICVECYDQLTISFRFLKKCRETEAKLSQLLKENNTSEHAINLSEEKQNTHVNTSSLASVLKEQGAIFDDIIIQQPAVSPEYSECNSSITRSSNDPSPDLTNKNYIQRKHKSCNKHLNNNNGKVSWNCTITHCQRKFEVESELISHLRMHPGDIPIKDTSKSVCNFCHKVLTSPANLKVHLRIHTGEKPYECPLCRKTFAQLGSLISHKRRHNREKPFACSVCPKRFTERSHLKRHQAVHRSERPFSCKTCGKRVKSNFALRQHNKLHSDKKDFICDRCGIPFSSKGNLICHIKVIHSDKSGQCSICDKLCPDLADHMLRHSEIKQYCCEVCKKSFNQKRGLSLHRRHMHTAAGRFNCSVGSCSRSFYAKWILDCHLLKHSGQTPYTCNYCSKGFLRVCHLTNHLKLNHPKEM